LDFNNAVKGEYVKDKWALSNGIIISAKKDADCSTTLGYTPWGAARVFDTADPGTNNDNGDPDLGSPNVGCNPSGPGVGDGGNPLINTNNPNAWNCVPQNKSLIVQETNKTAPDDASCGGTITFDFYDAPAFINEVGILDVDGHESVTLTVSDSANLFPGAFILDCLTDAVCCFDLTLTGHKGWRRVAGHYCASFWRQLVGETPDQYWQRDQVECLL
jgi:hypothetical protein